MVNEISMIIGTVGLILLISSVLAYLVAYDRKTRKILIVGIGISVGGVVLVSISLFGEALTGGTLSTLISNVAISIPSIGLIGSIFTSFTVPLSLSHFLPLQYVPWYVFDIYTMMTSFIFFIVGVFLAVWTYNDAKKRYEEGDGWIIGWTVIVIFFGIFGFIFYIIFRQKTIINPEPIRMNNYLSIEW